MHRTSIGRLGLVAMLALGLVAAACNRGDSSSGGSSPSVSITSPGDGSSVSEPFTLKVNSSEPIGAPSTGDDHVHICFDGASCDSGSYQIAYRDSATVTGLSAGKHTIEVSLRHADHSAAGATAKISVTVTSAGGATSSPTSGGKGYGY